MDSLSPRQSITLTHGVIENYLVIRLIDCDPLTRSYINRVHGSPSLLLYRSYIFFRRRSKGALASARERRLSGVRSANKSNTPRFVQRESSSFTIHEFIMGTTEDTAGPLLLIYRYASPGPIHLDARSWPRERGRRREKIKLIPPSAEDIHPSSLSPCTLNFCEKCILNLNHADAAWIMIPRFSNCYSFDRWGFRYKYNRDYKVSNSLRILVIFHPHLRTIRRGLKTEACPRQRTVSNKRKKEKRRFFTFTRDKYVSTSRGVESVSTETYLRNPVVH